MKVQISLLFIFGICSIIVQSSDPKTASFDSKIAGCRKRLVLEPVVVSQLYRDEYSPMQYVSHVEKKRERRRHKVLKLSDDIAHCKSEKQWELLYARMLKLQFKYRAYTNRTDFVTVDEVLQTGEQSFDDLQDSLRAKFQQLAPKAPTSSPVTKQLPNCTEKDLPAIFQTLQLLTGNPVAPMRPYSPFFPYDFKKGDYSDDGGDNLDVSFVEFDQEGSAPSRMVVHSDTDLL